METNYLSTIWAFPFFLSDTLIQSFFGGYVQIQLNVETSLATPPFFRLTDSSISIILKYA